MEEPRHRIRLVAAGVARTALSNVLGVIRGDDVLARLCVIHLRLPVREEAVEDPVEDASCDERVDVADGEQMLAPNRNRSGPVTGGNNVVDEAR